MSCDGERTEEGVKWTEPPHQVYLVNERDEPCEIRRRRRAGGSVGLRALIAGLPGEDGPVRAVRRRRREPATLLPLLLLRRRQRRRRPGALLTILLQRCRRWRRGGRGAQGAPGCRRRRRRRCTQGQGGQGGGGDGQGAGVGEPSPRRRGGAVGGGAVAAPRRDALEQRAQQLLERLRVQLAGRRARRGAPRYACGGKAQVASP